MDKRVFFGVAVSLVLVCLVLAAGCTGEKKADYIVGVDADYAPFSYVDEKGNYVGFDVESVKYIAEQNGFTVEIKGVAWDGIVEALKLGKIDMIYSGMTITPERAEQVAFTNPYWTVNQGLAGKADSTATVEQFKAGELIIGVQRSCSADQWMQDFFGEEKYNEMVKAGKINLYDTFPQSMVALGNGQVDVVIFDDVNIEFYINGKSQYKLVGTINTDEQYGVAIRKADTSLLATMNAGLAQLIDSDKWNELVKKYFVEEA